MALITHINVRSADNDIYCCLRNKVVKLDGQQQEQFCSGCKMFAGDAGGRGVACVWEDVRDIGNPHVVFNPLEEFASNQLRQVPPDGPGLFLQSDS